MLTNLVQFFLQDFNIRDQASALSQFSEQLSQSATSFLAFSASIAGSIVNFFVGLTVVLVLAFFMQMEKEKIRDYIRYMFPRSYRMYIDHKTDAVHHKMSLWIRGQIVLCLSIGTLVFIALMILGMQEYALTLALLAGFTEFIPVAGPLIAAVPAVLIGVTQQGWAWGLIVAAVYYAVQWSENNLLVPLIMKRAVGLSPIAIMFAMLVGISFPETIHPILGIILAVPVTTIIAIFIDDWQEMRRRE
jgi:predicted PurR-regulated permease PerM